MAKRRTFRPEFKACRKARKTTNSAHDFPSYPNLVQDLKIVRPDQVWVSDIIYIHLRYEFVYVAVIMEVITHSTPGWHLGGDLDHSLTLIALDHYSPKDDRPACPGRKCRPLRDHQMVSPNSPLGAPSKRQSCDGFHLSENRCTRADAAGGSVRERLADHCAASREEASLPEVSSTHLIH